MELDNVIIGARLNEIQKTPKEVKLVFESKRAGTNYILTFNGLLFETFAPTLDKRVKNIQLTDTIGFRASTQLRYLQKNPEDYRQLFIQMEGSNDDNKLELVGAVKNYKITSRRKRETTHKRTHETMKRTETK